VVLPTQIDTPAARSRPFAIVGLALLFVLATTPPAEAALSFRFDRASARPGTAMTASQPGWPAATRGITVYLVPTKPPGIRPDPAGGYLLPTPPRSAIRLGQPRLTHSHRLTISFRVPNVAAGDYTIAFWCRTCTKGGDFFASAPWGAAATGKPEGLVTAPRSR
jgi:hypothetical protein